jgi:hypothetical protein
MSSEKNGGTAGGGGGGGGQIEVLKWAESKGANLGLTVSDVDKANGTKIVYDRAAGRALTSEEVEGLVVSPLEPPVRLVALTVDALCAMLDRICGGGDSPYKPIVLVSLGAIEAYRDEEAIAYGDAVRMDLAISQTWHRVRALRQSQRTGQRELRTLLKTDMQARYEPANLVELISDLKSVSNTTGTSKISQGASKVDVDIVAEVTGTDKLPEDVVIDAAVWDNVLIDEVPHMQRVGATLDVDALADKPLLLRAKAGQVERAEAEAVGWLAGVVRRTLKEIAAGREGDGGIKSVGVFEALPMKSNVQAWSFEA